MSEAFFAPCISIISGATRNEQKHNSIYPSSWKASQSLQSNCAVITSAVHTPVGRANDSLVVLVHISRHAKVRDLDDIVLGGENVGRLDVAMDHTLIVQILQTLQHLASETTIIAECDRTRSNDHPIGFYHSNLNHRVPAPCSARRDARGSDHPRQTPSSGLAETPSPRTPAR